MMLTYLNYIKLISHNQFSYYSALFIKVMFHYSLLIPSLSLYDLNFLF